MSSKPHSCHLSCCGQRGDRLLMGALLGSLIVGLTSMSLGCSGRPRAAKQPQVSIVHFGETTLDRMRFCRDYHDGAHLPADEVCGIPYP